MNSYRKTLTLVFLGYIVTFVAGPSRVLALDAIPVQIFDLRNPPNLEWGPPPPSPPATPSPDPSGITYVCADPPLTCANTLLISDGEVEEMTPSTGCGTACWANANLFETDLQRNLGPTSSTTGSNPTDASTNTNPCNFSDEPSGAAYNRTNGHYFFVDDDRDRVFEINPGADGMLGDCLTSGDNSITGTVRVSDFGSTDPEGVGFDASGASDPSGQNQKALWIADGTNVEVYKILLGLNGVLGGGDDTVTHFDAALFGLSDLEGIDFHPDFGHLFIVSPGESDDLVQITPAGGLVRKLNMLVPPVDPRNSAGVAVAPSSVLPDPNPEWNVYVSDRRVDNNSVSTENDGEVFEFDLPQLSGNNVPPSADAGPPRTIYEPGSASLDATVTDDGLPTPPGVVTVEWTESPGSGGPGTVTFAPPNAVDTTASFSASGTYDLLLTADDGGLTSSDLVTVNVLPKVAASTIYLSTVGSGSVGAINFGDEDLLAYDVDAATWSRYFDGSSFGLGASSVDIDAFHILPPDASYPQGSILISLTSAITTLTVNGVPNTSVADSDILRFNRASGTYEWYFDGSDVGLASSSEDVDVITFLPDGRLVVSTTGSYSVTGLSGGDEDLIAFTGSLGATTTGSFSMHFDGSDVGADLNNSSSEDVDGAWIDNNGNIYLSTRGAFSVTNVSGNALDVFICAPVSTGPTTACNYSPFWNANIAGLAASHMIDGIDVAL